MSIASQTPSDVGQKALYGDTTDRDRSSIIRVVGFARATGRFGLTSF